MVQRNSVDRSMYPTIYKALRIVQGCAVPGPLRGGSWRTAVDEIQCYAQSGYARPFPQAYGPGSGAVFHRDQADYLPIQKLEKMRPSRSSELKAPVISPSACWA